MENNKDVKTAGINPVIHYMYHGFKEGRKPSLKFDNKYYMKRYKDVRRSKLNPLVHYALYGKKKVGLSMRITNFQCSLKKKLRQDIMK